MKRRHAIEGAAWLIGVGLISAYSGARWWYASAYETALSTFETAKSVAQTERPQQQEQPVDMSTWSRQRVEHYRESLKADIVPEALLRMPSLKLVVPVFDGASEINLNRGAGRIEGTARIGEQGNIGIAAHRDGFFRVLKDVRVGDVLLIERLANTEEYRVVSTRIVDPSDVSVLDATTIRTVTLVTCYPFYHVGSAPKRFIVRAEVVGEEQRDPTSALAEAND